MTSTISKFGEGMTKIRLILAIIILSSIFLGCVQPPQPAGTPTPTAAPTATATVEPTVVAYTPTPVSTTAPTTKVFPITYKVWIDSDYGFREVRAVNGTTNVPLPSNFDDLNVTINTGDKVIWINDDSYDFPLTVVSNEGLFTNQTGRLRYRETRVEYTFNRSGSYTFFIKEYPRIKNQKIFVNQ